MSCFEAIKKERIYGHVICGSIAKDQYQFLGVASIEHSESVGAIAAAFGLSSDAKRYREIDAELARTILANFLYRGQAYHLQIMSLERAEELALQFMQEFGRPPCRFFTNWNFEQRADGLLYKTWGWDVTDATFNTGVLVLGLQKSACVWIEDED